MRAFEDGRWVMGERCWMDFFNAKSAKIFYVDYVDRRKGTSFS